MEQKEILKKVQDIFRDVIEDDEIVLSNDTTSEDIEGYDSLAHIQIVKAIEDMFSIKFKAVEMIGWSNIGEMVECISCKTK